MIWAIIIGGIYLGLLAFSAVRARNRNVGNSEEILFARSGLPVTLLFLSFSATLFSTFTLMGVPDFFRNHGAATWLFIGVTDVAMGFVVLWFGLKYKKVLAKERLRGVSSLLKARYGDYFALTVYILAIFVFMAPYVAIQIQGVSQIATALTTSAIPPWTWSVVLLTLIFVYSSVGGLRAIMYSDVAQGLILLIVIYLVSYTLTSSIGGPAELFSRINLERSELLSVPGPNGFMTPQYLIATFFAILWMPITQPQLTSRIAAAQNEKSIAIMAVGISAFALIILIPTIFIGLYGALVYPDLSSGEFLARVLVQDQAPFVGGLALIGLLAAAMSTADSQLFALGSESQLALSKNEGRIDPRRTKLVIMVFSVGCLVLSLLSQTELASLARVSFAGTAIVGPMIVLALVSEQRMSNFTPAVTLLSLILFSLGSIGSIPNMYYGIRLDLLLIGLTAAVSALQFSISRSAP